ncbi:MAG: hypothetical protein ALECFALPRED_003450 [Alectoria fallacina]|uniref:Uncharacterized protein n=1 Tax=Alectoria fallacina TaxID=1903189 RepID=A0A8H3FKZ8_9LECA|nr:MAG: hypothetical protein ALECFALPRED_003450 [Alectoria fallacina]
MFTETKTSQQLYEDEKLRNTLLKKKLVRLEIKFEREKARLKAELKREEEICEVTFEQLDRLKMSFEIIKGKLDAHIEQLQTSLNDVDRPRSSGDKEFEELQARIKLLEDADQTSRSKLDECYIELSNAKRDLVDLKTTNRRLEMMNRMQKNIYEVLELQSHRAEIEYEDHKNVHEDDSLVKLGKTLVMPQIQSDTFPTNPTPTTQAVGSRSWSPIIPPPPSTDPVKAQMSPAEI